MARLALDQDLAPQSHPPVPELLDLDLELAALRPRMTAVALRMVRSADVADDIVQSGYEKAVRKLDQFDGRSQFSTWLHRIVVNEALMWLRSERRRGRAAVAGLDLDQLPNDEMAASAADAPTRMIEDERRRALLESLARLPNPERDVIQRVALDGLSYEDFERETGVKPAAAKSRAFRGRRRLEAWLRHAV